MTININHHYYCDPQITSKVDKILNRLNNMVTKQEFKEATDALRSSLDNLGADIIRLTDQLITGGLSDADEQEVLTELRGLGDLAKTLADKTPEPPTT